MCMSDSHVAHIELQSSIEQRFTVKNYLVNKQTHKKLLLSDESGHCIVRSIVQKPVDITVYERLLDISSPYICNILEICESEDAYIIYEEYCEGMTLDELGTGISEKQALDIAMSICSGLYVLHQCSIVHRDLKPENIIIGDDNSVKIIAFDSARLFKTGSGNDTQLLGTIGYAAPEQFGFSQTDNKADLYSLCVILNMLITGYHPSVKMCENKHIKKILQKCLSINPNERYNDANELNKAFAKARRWCK